MSQVPGVVVPQEILKRMEQAADPKEEGIAIALELIDKLKQTPGVSGLHIMAVHWEEVVPRLVQAANLQPSLRLTAEPAQARLGGTAI